MRRSILHIVLTGLAALMLLPCAYAKDRLSVFVSIAPQKYFVQKIGRDLVDGRVTVQPGADPRTYEPKPAQLKTLIELARQSDINVIFAQPQFSAKSAQLIAREIDGQVAFVDPLAQDWSANLREVADKFKSALK